MDNYSWGQNSEMCYENVAIGENNYGILFCANVNTNCRNIMYSMQCGSSSNCFACVGLRNAEYCILNKQYTKEEYEKLVKKVVASMVENGEWGEFFHPSLSLFGYNETVAQEYYPINLDSPLLKGVGGIYHRSTYEAPKPVSDKIIKGSDLNEIDTLGTDHIRPKSDDILQYAIECEVTGKLFRIQPQELAFYRKHNIPLPHKHPDQRHLERLGMRK